MTQEICGAVDLLSGSVCNRDTQHPGSHRDNDGGIEISWLDEASFAIQQEPGIADQGVGEFVSYYTDLYE